jgi:hypothetical protein
MPIHTFFHIPGPNLFSSLLLQSLNINLPLSHFCPRSSQPGPGIIRNIMQFTRRHGIRTAVLLILMLVLVVIIMRGRKGFGTAV